MESFNLLRKQYDQALIDKKAKDAESTRQEEARRNRTEQEIVASRHTEQNIRARELANKTCIYRDYDALGRDALVREYKSEWYKVGEHEGAEMQARLRKVSDIIRVHGIEEGTELKNVSIDLRVSDGEVSTSEAQDVFYFFANPHERVTQSPYRLPKTVEVDTPAWNEMVEILDVIEQQSSVLTSQGAG